VPARLGPDRGAGRGGSDLRDSNVAARKRDEEVDDFGYSVVLRVAWTLADLAGRTVPGEDEVAEALGMRLQRVAA
jgi:predicted ATPase with chaperone activity